MKMENALLENAVQYAIKNTTYYSQYAGKTFDEIPILTKQEYQKNSYPLSNVMQVSSIDHCFVFSTSGTTFQPQFIIRDLEDINYQINDYCGLHIDKNDIVLNLFWGGIWGVYTTANMTLSKTGATIIPFGGNNIEDMEIVYKIIMEFNVNVLFGVPSTIIDVAHFFERKNESSPIRKIFCIGEKMDDQSYSFIRAVFPQCNIKTKYGCMESAGIGYQCEHLNRNQYHIFENRYVEILTDDYSGHAGLGERGRIIVTTLNKRKVPLLRFDTGDIGYFEKKKCHCGEDTILTIIGREDNEFIIASVHMEKSILDALIKKNASGYITHQVILQKDDCMDKIKICLQCTRFNTSHFLHELFLSAPDLSYVIKTGRMKPIEFSYEKKSIIYNNKNGKMQKYVDLR